MVSRIHTTSGHKSAPRSTKASSTPRTSFEQWENVNDNAHSSQQHSSQQHHSQQYAGGYDRRAKSSMRYQSSGRTRQRGDNLPLQQQSKPTSSQRPRPISTGRLRDPEDDPAAVEREIMELRERRESGSLAKSSSSRNMQRGPAVNNRRKDSPMALHPSISTAGNRGLGNGGGNSSSPKGQNLAPSGSNLSYEDMQANARLENAESKISGLLQELEELKFFEEIEAAKPPPTTPRTPKTPRTPSAAPMTYSNPPHQRTGPMSSPRTPGGGIPTSIRASSSPARARLPPPPPPTSKPQEEACVTLSPRKIAKMDRLSLELETQTLIRKVQVLDGERHSMEAMIKMYETSLQGQDKDKARTRRLEEELRNVSSELKKQLLSIQNSKEMLAQEFGDKLDANMKKLHKTQEQCDSYKMDAEVAKSDSEKWFMETERLRISVKEEKAMSEDATAREAVRELQFTEARNLNAQLQKKMEKHRNEASSLKQELLNAENTDNRDEVYEVRIAALQQELALSQDRHANVELELQEQEASLEDKLEELKAAKAKETEQAILITELQSQLENLAKYHKNKLEDFKKSNNSASNRKMQDLVDERANLQNQYESRIHTLQQQLKHQADRHAAEVVETRKINEEQLNEMKDTIRHEVFLEEGDAKMMLENEMSILKRNNEDAKYDFQRRLKEAENKGRQTNAEWKRQEEVRQQELDHMHDRLQNYVSDLAEREERIRQLTEDIESIGERNRENESDAQDRQQADLRKRDDLAEETRMKYKELELELREEIVKKETTFAEMEQKMNADIAETHEKLVEAHTVIQENETIKQRIEDVQNAFDSVQQGLSSERSRHQTIESELRVEIAKIEGKLRASESSLKQKRARIEDLEDQLKDAESYSKAEQDRLAEIQYLKNDLDETSERLENERLQVNEKDGMIDRLRREMKAVQKKANEMAMLEDVVKEMRRRVATIEEDKSEQSAELEKLRIELEVATTKLIETDQKHSIVKGGIEAELQSSEKFYQDSVQRYIKTVQELESKLAAEETTKTELECAVDDLKWNLARAKEAKSIQTDELSILRRDYQELSGVVEENMDFSARKDELDLELARKEKELRETVEKYSKTVLELEDTVEKETKSKLSLEDSLARLQVSLEKTQEERNALVSTVEKETKSKLSLEDSLARLQVSLEKTQEERNTLVSELSLLRQEKEETASQLMEAERSHLQSKGGIDAEIGRKDRQLREAIQRYTCNIAELESKLEEETQLKSESEDKLDSVRAELESKQKTTEELIQRQKKTERSLETQIDRDAVEKEELKLKLDKATSDLEKKKKELKETIDEFTIQITELEGVKSQHSEYKVMSQTTRDELERKEKQMSEIQMKIPELLSELDKSNRERDDHKSKVEKLESELAKKKEQLNEVVSRSTDTIADLEAQVDQQSAASESTQGRIETVRSEVSRKDERIKELEKNIADLQSKSLKYSSDADSAKQSFDEIARDLDDKESQLHKFEMEKIELETRLNAQSRSKEVSRTKISELTSKLERKEREVREVTDRYKMYVGELESKLDQDGTSKFRLQSEVDKLKIDLMSASDASTDAIELRERVSSLEKSVENYRGKARDAESRAKDKIMALAERLASATKSKDEIDAVLKKVNGEKAEVIAALEGVIHEVQNREDEIESLSDILHKRDEELEHAKTIATKALSSAKDIQKRYKDKEKEVSSGLFEKMDELHDDIDMLNSKNDTLERKISMLERDLRERTLECKRLKDQLRQIDGNTLSDNEFFKSSDNEFFKSNDDATHSTYLSSRSHTSNVGSNFGSSHGSKMGRSLNIDADSINRGSGLEPDAFSPAHSPQSPTDGFGEEEYPAFEVQRSASNDGLSTSSPELMGQAANTWLSDYDNEDRSGIESIPSEAGSSNSRRSTERDALRKYVRNRYMNRK